MTEQPIDILLVEDNEGDVRLTIEALRDGKISNQLSVARDGFEALAFVRREGRFAAAPRPGLILLDLDLPLKDGRQVLVDLKVDPILSAIPVVILTASQAQTDVLRAHQLDARAYITKPVDLEKFLSVVRQLKRYLHADLILPAL